MTLGTRGYPIRSKASPIIRRQPLRQPPPFLFRSRNSKANALRRVGEGARQNSLAQQVDEALSRGCTMRETKELRSSDNRPAAIGEQPVEPHRVGGEPRRAGFEPARVRQRGAADRDGGAADRPGAQRRPQRLRDVGRGDREAEPHTGEAVGLAERAQHDRVSRQAGRQRVFGRVEIHEGFVDDQRAAAPGQSVAELDESGALDDPPIGIVGIDDDRRVAIGEPSEGVGALYLRARRAPGAFVAKVGRPKHADAFRWQQARQRLDELLRARGGDDMGRRGGAVPRRGGRFEPGEAFAVRQPRPGFRFERGQGIGMRIDSCGEVDPRLRRVGHKTARDGEIAAVIGQRLES